MSKNKGFTAADVPDQTGKCFLITGANTGLGFECARVLAAKNARVILACRDEAKAQAAIDAIRQETPGASLRFLPINLADLDSIRDAANLVQDEPRIDVLINNAGVMGTKRLQTAQGLELQFGVNHLGAFAITGLLLPKIAEAPQPRVVTTSSIAHTAAKTISWDDLTAEKSYNRVTRYAQSKLANALFFFELDRRLRAAGSPVVAVGCHPGIATTELTRHLGPIDALASLSGFMMNSPASGAWPTLLAATGDVEPGGYYGPSSFQEVRGPAGPASRRRAATNPALATRLWETSIALSGVDPGLPAVD